jgi:hypothetical protein
MVTDCRARQPRKLEGKTAPAGWPRVSLQPAERHNGLATPDFRAH